MSSGVPFSVEQLWDAWERVRENAGCSGTDAVSVERFSRFADKRIPEILARVSEGSYRPWPLLRIVVEKKPGSTQTRTLLVPTVTDRVLQTAVARHLSHSFEEEFLECSYGYRPGRSVDRAIARIRKCHELGFRYVVDADVHSYFDNVDHRVLLELLAARPLGPVIQGLLRQWVKAPVWDGSQVHPLHAGVPQGSPISPLLANYYLSHFDREMEKSGRKLVRYADDFLVLAKTPEEAQQALLQTETLLAEAHLKVNEQKTHITDFEEGFRFLGALFLGDATWVPWKHGHQKGRVLFMAKPLPANLRAKYEFAPPKSTMELALEKAEVAGPVVQEHRSARAEEGDDVAFLYLTEQGSILRKSGDRLLVEKEDEILLDIPYHKLETILLFGNVQVTTQAMGELLEKGVGMSLFSRQGRYRGQLEAPRGKNIELRIAQFEAFRDHGRALGMARALVKAKVTNGLAVIDHYRAHNQAAEDFAERRGRLEEAIETCGSAADIAALDGVEGAAAREYFGLLMGFNKSELVWPGRVRHPATDPLNALLSLTYTLIMSELTGLLEGAGLDPYLGFLHQVDYGRPSLALDVMEPFRHGVADRLVLWLVNQGAVDATDFVAGEQGRGVFLAPKPMRRYFEAYEKWILSRADGSTGFRAAMRAEVEKLSTALRTGGEFAPWLWRAETEATCNTSSVTT